MHAVTQSCVLLLWMHTLTFVRSQDCSLQQFLNSDLYNSNFDTTNLEANYPDKRSVRVGCNVGYSGFFKLICNKGKWSHRGTSCQPRSCGHPGDAQFADFQLDEGEDFVFGSRVVYTCHKGYQMVSRTNHRRCMAEGWDGVVPVCEAQQCPVIRVDDNVQVNGDLEEATFGNVVRFSCKSNSQILKGSVEIYCEESGEWSGPAPKCKDVTCDRPVIEHGRVIGDNLDYKEHEVLQFECNHRYTRTEFRPSTCIKVGSRAEFSPTPVCEPVRCRLERAPGTWFENEQRNLVSPGETVTVNCGEKYWIVNQQTTSTVTTCQDNGQWTVTPACKEVICNRWDQLVTYWYDTRQIKLGDRVHYQCKTRYKKRDDRIPATCTRNGWHPNPLCEEIICQRLELQNAIIHNDNRQEYRSNEQINYDCNEGYRGRPSRTCTARGWTGHTQCEAITCNRQNIQNADIDGNNVKQKYTFNERVDYVCKKGYKGDVFRTCTEIGLTGNSQCTEITCPRQEVTNANIVNDDRQEYRYNELVKYDCKEGYEGPVTRTCKENGLTGDSQCTKTCPKPRLQHGFFVRPANNDTLYYTCNEGYKLFTKAWWGVARCGDRNLSGRCIEESTCGEFPMIPNGRVIRDNNGGNKISCDKGYQVPNDNLICHEGSWTAGGSLPELTCTRISGCSYPEKVANAVITTPYQRDYLHGSTVTYKCRKEYKIDGENTLQCISGTWEEKNIICTKITCPRQEVVNANIVNDDRQEYAYNEQVNYVCKEGYEGRVTRTCTENGLTGDSLCTAQQCFMIRVDDNVQVNGNLEEATNGTVVRFSCKSNTDILQGSAEIYCEENGEWSGPAPKCKGVKTSSGICQRVELQNAIIDNDNRQEYRLNEQINYDCNEGYKGAPFRTCTARGWMGRTQCQAITCNRRGIQNAVIDPSNVKQKYAYNERVNYVCKRGYKGDVFRTCTENGWTGNSQCTEITCQRQEVTNANIVNDDRQEYAYNERVHYDCKEGYEGRVTRTCTENGLTGDSNCTTITCDREDIQNADIDGNNDKQIYAYNDWVHYVCKNGRGDFYRTCKRDGWTGDIQCTG